jgi:hypothetical protein
MRKEKVMLIFGNPLGSPTGLEKLREMPVAVIQLNHARICHSIESRTRRLILVLSRFFVWIPLVVYRNQVAGGFMLGYQSRREMGVVQTGE